MRFRFAPLLALLILAGCVPETVPEPFVSTLTGPFAGSGGIVVHPGHDALYVGNFGDAFGTDPAVWGNDVKRVGMDGTVSDFAEGFFVASGNALAADGETLLQVELGRGIVFRIDSTGTATPWATGLARPVGVVAAPDGGAFVAECGGNSIRRIAPDGTPSLIAEGDLFNCPNGITRAPDGSLYVANFNDGRVLHIAPDGAARLLATTPGGGNGHLVFARGALYVADRSGHQIIRVGLNGSVEAFAGSGAPGNVDSTLAEAQFRLPNGIAASPDGGTLYVTSKVSEDPTELNPVLVRVITGVPEIGGAQ